MKLWSFNLYTVPSILSDSMSMPKKVQTGHLCRQWLESVPRPGLQCITFAFVPGHAGIKSNERADSLARKATYVDGRAMGCNIVNDISDFCRNVFSGSDLNFTSVT